MFHALLLTPLLWFHVCALYPHPGTLGEPPGPMVTPTKGEVWPKPQHSKRFNNYYMVIRINFFKFKTVNTTCDILEAAMSRYYRILVEERDAGRRAFVKPSSPDTIRRKQWFTDFNFRGYLNVLHIDLNSSCEYLPYLDMDERYELQIDSPDYPNAGKLSSQSIWGILRGLETFVQLVHTEEHSTEMHIHSSYIFDFPRFKHRGLLVDTARHFYPLTILMSIIDGLEASKLNVLHWHIVDEQAFPYQSKVFPELSDKGAYHPVTHVYTQDDIKTIIEYCRIRGIRVIPEFDSPGHTRSWGQSHLEILTKCFDVLDASDGSYGPLDPSNEKTYSFIKTLFTEVKNLFPDKYFHLGGDEVDFECWKSNQQITAFMKNNNISDEYNKLEQMYISKIINITEEMGSTAMVWQEVLDNGLTLSKNTIVEAWKGVSEVLDTITKAGHLALLSSCWYLDHDIDWKEFYNCEPHSFNGSDAQNKLVIGGESCIWSEYEDASTIVQRVYPRASAMAERLWSNKTEIGTIQADVLTETERRLEEFRCRLLRRGVAARPHGGASYCPGEFAADWPGLAGAHKLRDWENYRVYLKEKDYKLRVEYTDLFNAM